jgi:hypothetical protein
VLLTINGDKPQAGLGLRLSCTTALFLLLYALRRVAMWDEKFPLVCRACFCQLFTIGMMLFFWGREVIFYAIGYKF